MIVLSQNANTISIILILSAERKAAMVEMLERCVAHLIVKIKIADHHVRPQCLVQSIVVLVLSSLCFLHRLQ